LVWAIEYSDTARKQLRKLGNPVSKRIVDFLDQRIAGKNNPRDSGKALSGPIGGLWRYRIGDYRIVCDIQDNRLRVLVLQVGHRRNIYRQIN